MARLNVQHSSTSNASTPARDLRSSPDATPSPSPSADSDKENHTRSTARPKRKSLEVTPRGPAPRPGDSAQKRARLNHSASMSNHGTQRRQTEVRMDKQYYDPDQNDDERRAVKKQMRETHKTLLDSRTDFLKAGSDGLTRTLRDADHIFRQVKQTSDATIDSRLLVDVADLSHKKISELTLGDASVGVDVDEFVSKCISFMKNGAEDRARDRPGGLPSGTQTQRRRRRQQDDEEEETGDALDWEFLGTNACFRYNSRPCLSGFMLGPLSVQKKVRQQTQRRAKERANPANAVRPLTELEEDPEHAESASLTVVCKEIAALLGRVRARGEASVEAEWTEDMESNETQAQALFRKHGIADNGLVPLFHFCVNPKSFGQTVENLFYVSFLIKEGTVGFGFDGQGLPTLGIADQKTVEQRQDTVRNQAVFTLDFETWESIVDSFGITESIIPHREEVEFDDGTVGSGPGFYD